MLDKRPFRATVIAAAIAFVAMPSLAAPQTGVIDGYRELVRQDLRLAKTGYRLAQANAPYCQIKSRNPGWVLHSYHQYPDREIARAGFKFTQPVAIAAVVPNGPGDRAGLKAGDSLVDMPGGIVWSAEPSKHMPNAELIDRINLRFRRLWAGKGQAALQFESGTRRWHMDLDPPNVCSSDFLISTGNAMDAGADGQTVRVSLKLAQYVTDDQEFAAVVAHEFSHNILRHRERLDALKVKRGVGRLFGKSKDAILATEIEADQLSVWLLANAGYDPHASIRFWQRYGPAHGEGLFSAGTHLRWKRRVTLLRSEIVAIDALPSNSRPHSPPLLAKM